MIAVCALIEKKTRFLACRRPFGVKYSNFYELPTGVLEEDETVEDCLERTCFETLSRHAVDYSLESVFDAPEDKDCKIFLFRAKLDNNYVQLQRYSEVKWLSINKIPKNGLMGFSVTAVKLNKIHNSICTV